MINVTVTLKDGETRIEATGHSGYAEPGKDIVCAAVSAILTTAALGLEALAKEYPECVKIESE